MSTEQNHEIGVAVQLFAVSADQIHGLKAHLIKVYEWSSVALCSNSAQINFLELIVKNLNYEKEY